jgi:outer membrane usher protein
MLGAGGLAHAASAASGGASGEIQFDTRSLEAQGISPEVARFFSRGARFLPGVHEVKLSLNAGRSRSLQVRFDNSGQLCFDHTLLRQLGLLVPEGLGDNACMDAEGLPGMRVDLWPGRSAIDVTVPEAAFDSALRDSAYQRGGSAAILNYNVFAQRFQGTGGARDYVQARLEPGFNLANWVVRSSGTYTRSSQRSTYRQNATYAQRSVESLNSLAQMGQIYAMSDGYGGMPLLGAQLFSDAAQMQSGTLTVPIQGVAETNAVIEIRQRGQVVYRTVVPPGPYTLSEIGGVSNSTDIEVLVTEEDGRTSRSTLPAPMSQVVGGLPATYHFGIGQYRREWGAAWRGRMPWVAYGDYAFNLGPDLRASVAALASAGYQSAYGQLSLGRGNTWLGGSARLSRANGRGMGHEWQVQSSTSLVGNVSAGISWQARSAGYTSLEDTLVRPGDGGEDDWSYVSPFQQSLSASLTWSHLSWGAFSYSLSRSRDRHGVYTAQSFGAARKFGRVSANLSVQMADGGRNTLYLNLRVPLGRDSAGVRLQRQASGSTGIAANYQGRAGSIGYQADAWKSDSSQRLSASAQSSTAYSQWAIGASTTDSRSRAFYASGNGGIALAGDRTLAFSSSRISDTFAVVKIPGVSGIRMNGGESGAKTSSLGNALVPAIYPYQKARIQLDGKTLPLNYRFDTTAIDLSLARGTVSMQTIGATEVRQLMLKVRMSNGDPAKVGAGVFNVERQFMGTVIGDGNIVLTNTDIGKSVFLESHSGNRCEVIYQAPASFDPHRPYEEADATCS